MTTAGGPVHAPLTVAIVGCGLIGHKRAAALGEDVLVGCHDISPEATRALANETGAIACPSVEALLGMGPDVVIVATYHDQLATLACSALDAGCHVLVEKPAGIGVTQVEAVAQAAEAADRLVKVGFNHRFHPAVARAVMEARSGAYGDIMFFRARYGHGGRPGYDKEWRADPKRSGGGEIVDQGMHLLDLSYWLLGDLPVHSAIVRTHFWSAPVEDNALVVLGVPGGVGDRSPWAVLHASWTEWKNLFSVEIACERAKVAVEGLAGSYGSQSLRIYRMRPEMGPPDLEEVEFPTRDESWEQEWRHFASVIRGSGSIPLLGDLDSARYAWSCIEQVRQMGTHA